MKIETSLVSCSVTCNPTLLEVLLNNLIINAIRHGDSGDCIKIVLTEQRLTVSNAGSAALNPDQLFVRFAISSSETTNSGLGLAISKEICDRYHWNLAYSFNDYLHQFSIKFQ